MKEVPEGKIAVLGLVTTKTPRRETPQQLIAHIDAAARFMPKECLALSPQCGFSSSVLGNRISMDDQKYKLQVIVETARRVWG